MREGGSVPLARVCHAAAEVGMGKKDSRSALSGLVGIEPRAVRQGDCTAARCPATDHRLPGISVPREAGQGTSPRVPLSRNAVHAVALTKAISVTSFELSVLIFV